jgi:hypothetical protein
MELHDTTARAEGHWRSLTPIVSHVNMAATEIKLYPNNVSDLYSADAQFESQPRYWLT